ncbi:hypothetical protein D0Y65_025156 [Glycine soja]|uniref:Uncharacterized protein n=1 Tax=Glycine soja TaxID=3848 RepID=A0A445J5J4_GLYSO|nr:hypothetical protein D0Y65_025156 [Glycine soja]
MVVEEPKHEQEEEPQNAESEEEEEEEDLTLEEEPVEKLLEMFTKEQLHSLAVGRGYGSRKPNILNLHLIELAILLSHHGFVESFFCFRTGQGEQCKLTNKFLLPIKPTRQPNPIIYRKLRRGSTAGRFQEKQIEPDKILSYNKAYIDEEDEEEWSSQSDEEKGKQGICYIFFLFPCDRYQDTFKTLERGSQGLRKNDSHIEHRAALAVKLYGVQAALLSALGNPFENLSQSKSSIPYRVWCPTLIRVSVRHRHNTHTTFYILDITGVYMLASVSCPVFVSVSVLHSTGFDVTCGMFRMSGILFASLGVLGFVLLLLVVVMMVLFASWSCAKQDGGAK